MARLRKAVRDETLAQTRRRLLEAAAVEFANEGFVGANINHISQAAGFAKGTVYNHFACKRDLMLSLIDEIAADHTRFILQQTESEPSPIGRLTRFFSAGFAFIESCPAWAQVIVNAVYGPDAEFRARVYQAYERLLALISRDIVGAGVAQGNFRAVDSALATALVMTIYLGGCSQLESDGKIWLDPDKVTTFILDGLRPRENAPQTR
jgi:AcrR family transcriptional regulator